jgi:peroxiredoxin
MKHPILWSLAALACLLDGRAWAEGESVAEERTGVGIQIRSFTLKDHRGRPVSLAKHAEGKLAVVAFLGTECPLAQLYGPRLAELAKKFEPRGVAFLAIDSNHQDTRNDIQHYVQVCQLGFPMLLDVNNLVANHFGATRTPEVYLLDRERVVRYRGRIDDQFGIKNGISYKRPAPNRNDLALAIEALLAGKAISEPVTEAPGCLIGRAPRPQQDARVTYASHVAAIFNRRCVECHRPGEVAPFSMVKYEDFEGWGDMIREVVAEDRMPPWHAAPEHGKFSNESRLSASEKQTILEWVDAGCPPGDLSRVPATPRFVKGWQLNDRKQIFYMNREGFEVPAEGEVDYQYYRVDPGFTRDMWVQAAEARAGDPSVVHHIIVFIEPPGTKPGGVSFDGFLVATAPGARPLDLPPGYAKRIPAGSKLKFQMHYTPNGKKTVDRSSVGLVYTDASTVKTVVRTDQAMNILFRIPPGADDFPVESLKTIRRDTLLVSLYPHMHLRGKAFRYTARYPDGKEEILLDIPRYDFNWQNSYELAEPKLLPKGTEIRCEARFDNSAKNPANPDPKATVTFGEQTWDEMMIGFMDVAVPRDEESETKTLVRTAVRGAESRAERAPPPKSKKTPVRRDSAAR